jgi:cardiolipin synthase
MMHLFTGTIFGYHVPWFVILHVVIAILFFLRIIWVRRPVGVAVSWLLIIVSFPIIGLILYLTIGERPVGRTLTSKIIRMEKEYAKISKAMRQLHEPDRSLLHLDAHAISLLAQAKNGTPVAAGNRIELFTNSLEILQHFIDEINRAQKSLHLEFYIWSLGGDADRVGEALIAASKRGVKCRVLLDSLGSSSWFKSAWPDRFAKAKIEVTEALPIQFGRFQFRRADLRLHRKIFIIDGEIAWTGSMNLVDPRTFKQDSGVGEWVDAMVRIQGPVVSQFELTFSYDWSVDNPRVMHFHDRDGLNQKPAGDALAQEFSSGPVYRDDILYQVLLSAILDARQELVITTPYFVPDEGLVQALMAAAHRGVKVKLIVPRLNDSTLVAWSSRSFYSALLGAGVEIAEFKGGLLHTKSLLIDERTAIFGSVNFDQRSLRLNFEISLIVYDQTFCTQLKQLTTSYLKRSQIINRIGWERRPRWRRLLENTAHLASPLL